MKSTPLPKLKPLKPLPSKSGPAPKTLTSLKKLAKSEPISKTQSPASKTSTKLKPLSPPKPQSPAPKTSTKLKALSPPKPQSPAPKTSTKLKPLTSLKPQSPAPKTSTKLKLLTSPKPQSPAPKTLTKLKPLSPPKKLAKSGPTPKTQSPAPKTLTKLKPLSPSKPQSPAPKFPFTLTKQKDTDFYITLMLEDEDLFNFCKAYPKLDICNDEKFWQQRFYKKFGQNEKPNTETWKQFYLNSYLNKMVFIFSELGYFLSSVTDKYKYAIPEYIREIIHSWIDHGVLTRNIIYKLCSLYEQNPYEKFSYIKNIKDFIKSNILEENNFTKEQIEYINDNEVKETLLSLNQHTSDWINNKNLNTKID